MTLVMCIVSGRIMEWWPRTVSDSLFTKSRLCGPSALSTQHTQCQTIKTQRVFCRKSRWRWDALSYPHVEGRSQFPTKTNVPLPFRMQLRSLGPLGPARCLCALGLCCLAVEFLFSFPPTVFPQPVATDSLATSHKGQQGRRSHHSFWASAVPPVLSPACTWPPEMTGASCPGTFLSFGLINRLASGHPSSRQLREAP